MLCSCTSMKEIAELAWGVPGKAWASCWPKAVVLLQRLWLLWMFNWFPPFSDHAPSFPICAKSRTDPVKLGEVNELSSLKIQSL